MAWYSLGNRDKIQSIINHLVSKKTEIKVRLENEDAEFGTRFLKFDSSGISTQGVEGGRVFMDKLFPDKGNELIQMLPEVNVEFSIHDRLCRCLLNYVGVSSTPPYYGFIFGMPDAIQISERRKEERIPYEMPEFVSVEFTLKPGGKRYALSVLDYSTQGLGILVTEEDFDLLGSLNPGDRLAEVTFFAKSAMIRVDGWVRHLTKISKGRHKGAYILGIESKDIVESCKPKKEIRGNRGF